MATARQLYEAVLIEMNKVEAPSMLLEDFNYFVNKAIMQYINKRYNLYDVNQQTSDDIRVLKATTKIMPKKGIDNPYGDSTFDSLYGSIEEFELPQDYLHILNCICNFKVADKGFKCYKGGSNVQFAARRLTSDMWSQVINNFYMKPTYKRPYYFLHNVNTNNELPTDTFSTVEYYDVNLNSVINIDSISANISIKSPTSLTKNINGKIEVIATVNNIPLNIYDNHDQIILTCGDDVIYLSNKENNSYVGRGFLPNIREDINVELDGYGSSEDPIGWNPSVYKKTQQGISPTITIGGVTVNAREHQETIRYGNSEPVRLEIRYGKDKSIFELTHIYVDYIKTPQHIQLTQEQIDLTEDTSQILEFPDYVCQEIINELVKLIMENASDPRLQTNMPVNQTIASPVPQGK